MGIQAARNKETIQAFGGELTISQFRRGFLTIDNYDWVTRYYSPRAPISKPPVASQYLYTLQPIRKTKTLDDEEEDPVILIKQRCFG